MIMMSSSSERMLEKRARRQRGALQHKQRQAQARSDEEEEQQQPETSSRPTMERLQAAGSGGELLIARSTGEQEGEKRGIELAETRMISHLFEANRWKKSKKKTIANIHKQQFDYGSIGNMNSARQRRRCSGATKSDRALPLWPACLAVLLSVAVCGALAARQQHQQVEQMQRRANEVELMRSRREQRETSAIEAPQAPVCGYPGSPAHASVTFNTSQVVAGTAASYTCDNGYELLGPPRRLCQANGTWSPVGIPFCVLNVGLGKAAMQSSTAGHGSAQKAVDGSTSPYFQASTCTMTDVESSPWWYVNLLEPYLVQIVRIDFGTACCANRQKATIAVRVGNNRPDLGNNPLCNRYQGFIEEGKPLFLPCTRPAPGAFVSIHLESPSGSALSICETFIYTDHALSTEQCPSFRDQPLGSTATYNGKCYLFHNNKALNFDGARKYCESRGGTLVDETSPALQGFLSWELYRRHRNDQLMGQYWLGAVKDPRNGQNWKWINGKDVQISFWSSLGSQGNCSRFDGSKGWLWSDTDCQSSLNFICQYRPLSCGKPEKPTNSTLVSKNIDNATVIEYQCAPGNLLLGPKSRACLPTGFFSEFAPKCKYLDCQFPAMIPNGDYKLLNGTTSYQSVVTYFCNDGFQLYGKATLICDSDERWNGPPPRCEPLLCSSPIPPSNGYVTVTANVTIPGTQATFDCRPGYELVGDRLLTCSQAGSWDNSFPYCRERRVVANVVTLAPALRQTPKQQSSSTKPASVQFPTVAPSISQSPSQQTTVSTSSPQSSSNSPPPASLNGLAGQFSPNINGQQATAAATTTTAAANEQALPDVSQNRKASQSSSVSQFVPPPLQQPQPPQIQPSPPLVELISQAPTPQLPVQLSGAGSGNQPQVGRFRPTLAATSSTATTASTASTSTTAATQPSSSSTVSSSQQAVSSNSNRQQQQSSTSRATFAPTGSQHQTHSSGFLDSSPLAATTNSISIHGQTATGSSQAPGTNTLVTAPPPVHHQTNHQQHQHNQLGVLASFSPPVRSHNMMASAKYSLDGIIAVAIFGGFIFLGAIITMVVVIIRRRKSSHSSTIDAQTISTYDSNGEHNGLYRNYQQAWENLRFAAPSSQPKSAGGGGNAPPTLMANPAAIGMKNFASVQVAANGSSQLLHHHHHHHNLHGIHNLGMSGTGSDSTSNASSGSLGPAAGVGGAASSAGGVALAGSGATDPLMQHQNHNYRATGHMRNSSLHYHHAHLHHHHHDDDLDELDDDGSERDVLSADDQNAGSQFRADQAGEGFRDSNELTINADTVLNGSQTGGASGRRLYQVRSNDQHRLSSGSNLEAQQRRHQHHHHHHSRHNSGSNSSSSQHQRLVPSSTPSTSTRSSRASPPSDDQTSLEQLAYGSSWHPAGSQQQQQSSQGQADHASQQQGRANSRFS